MPLDFDPNNPSYEYITTKKGLVELCEKLSKEKILSVDTEGTSLNYYYNKVLLIQIGVPDKAYIIDTQKIKDISPVKEILENKNILKILQNAKYDYGVLKAAYGMEIVNIYDTMLAEQIITNGLNQKVSLKAMADRYLNIQLDKDYESYNWERVGYTGRVLEKHKKYASLDVLILFPIFKAQYAKIRKEGLTRVAKLEFAVLPVVAEMELAGSYIDTKKWRNLINSLKERRQVAAKKIQEEVRPLYKVTQVDLFGNTADAINLNSQVQLMELFNDKLGLSVPSTGAGVLKKVDHPIAKMLLEYRGYEKLISAFGENLLAKINKKTGRLHPDYRQFGADTGRFACSNPNLQQIPRGSEFRGCFVAPPGKKLVTVDYSQQELRVLAEYSGDPTLVKAYEEGKDLHSVTASMMYGIPEERVRKDVERQAAKIINFGLMYGRGAESLSSQLGVSSEEGRKLLNMYFKKFSKVKRWLDKAAEDAIKNKCSTTLIGRKRYYTLPDKSDPNYERLIANIKRKGKNTPIQGSSADMIKFALVYIHKRIKKENLPARIIHTVHDEIVLEVDEEASEEVLKIQTEEMIRAGTHMLKKVPVAADGEISDVWEH